MAVAFQDLALRVLRFLFCASVSLKSCRCGTSRQPIIEALEMTVLHFPGDEGVFPEAFDTRSHLLASYSCQQFRDNWASF